MFDENIATILAPYKKILILTHEMPDGDCIGSALGLAQGLKQKGIYTDVVMKTPIPEKYSFLPGSEEILLPDSLNKQVEAVIFVDCSDMERIGFNLKEFCPKINMIINIDHHVSNTHFGHFNLVDTQAAATGEIIYKLLLKMEAEITPDIATALYTALVTDSGSFQYDNTTSTTLKLAADLLDYGANRKTIKKYIWENSSLTDINVLKAALNSLSFSAENKIAYIYLSLNTINSLQVSDENFEGLINYPRSIAGVEVAIFFKEIEPQVVKVSFRSKEYVDVNQLAAVFGGGGHVRAAGCTLSCSLDDAITQVLNVTQQRI
jgi:phosphoesterase RecJ-like protein